LVQVVQAEAEYRQLETPELTLFFQLSLQLAVDTAVQITSMAELEALGAAADMTQVLVVLGQQARVMVVVMAAELLVLAVAVAVALAQ